MNGFSNFDKSQKVYFSFYIRVEILRNIQTTIMFENSNKLVDCGKDLEKMNSLTIDRRNHLERLK